MSAGGVTLFWGRARPSLHQIRRQDGGLLSSEPFPSDLEAVGPKATFWKESVSHVRTQGGLIWKELTNEDGWTVNLASVSPPEGGRVQQPRRFWRLSGLGAVEELQLEAAGVSVAMQVGDTLILPVSAQAETELHELLSSVEAFDGDVRAALLHALRRSDLGGRVDRLERAVRRSPRPPSAAAEAGAAAQPEVAPAPSGMSAGNAVLLALSCLALGTVVGALAGEKMTRQEAEVEARRQLAAELAAQEPEPEPPPVPTREELDLARSLAALDTIAARSTVHSQETWSVARIHFADGILLDGQVRPEAAWGLLKLHFALRWKRAMLEDIGGSPRHQWLAPPSQDGLYVLSNDFAISLLADPESLRSLNDREAEAAAFAAVFCDAFDLPGAQHPERNELVSFSSKVDSCEGLTLADAAAGLESIAIALETTSSD